MTPAFWRRREKRAGRELDRAARLYHADRHSPECRCEGHRDGRTIGEKASAYFRAFERHLRIVRRATP